jgi:hypothetical protein
MIDKITTTKLTKQFNAFVKTIIKNNKNQDISNSLITTLFAFLITVSKNSNCTKEMWLTTCEYVWERSDNINTDLN